MTLTGGNKCRDIWEAATQGAVQIGFFRQFARQGLPLGAMYLLKNKWKAAKFCKQNPRTGNLQQEMKKGFIDPLARKVTDYGVPKEPLWSWI